MTKNYKYTFKIMYTVQRQCTFQSSSLQSIYLWLKLIFMMSFGNLDGKRFRAADANVPTRE